MKPYSTQLSWVLKPFLLLTLIAALAACNFPGEGPPEARNDGSLYTISRIFHRSPAQVHYSRHARCRMKCRAIDEGEVLLILKKGEVNFRKSQIGKKDCQNKYALEGQTPDGQQVRIIFAPCANETTVVTVIDLNKETDDPDCICKN